MAVRRGPPLAYSHRSILRNAGSLAIAAIPIRHTSLGTISNSGSSLLNGRPRAFILRVGKGDRTYLPVCGLSLQDYPQPQNVAGPRVKQQVAQGRRALTAEAQAT